MRDGEILELGRFECASTCTRYTRGDVALASASGSAAGVGRVERCWAAAPAGVKHATKKRGGFERYVLIREVQLGKPALAKNVAASVAAALGRQAALTLGFGARGDARTRPGSARLRRAASRQPHAGSWIEHFSQHSTFDGLQVFWLAAAAARRAHRVADAFSRPRYSCSSSDAAHGHVCVRPTIGRSTDQWAQLCTLKNVECGSPVPLHESLLAPVREWDTLAPT